MRNYFFLYKYFFYLHKLITSVFFPFQTIIIRLKLLNFQSKKFYVQYICHAGYHY